MSYIRIARVVFDNPPSENQLVTIKHRLSSDPDVDGSYTTDIVGQEINVYGYLLPPLVIDGLLSGELYTVKIINPCDDSEIEQEYLMGDCPDVDTITAISGGGNPIW